MWLLLVLVVVALVALFCLVFVLELVLAMKQEGSRPSTWLATLAATLRRAFFTLGRFLAMLPDIFGWLRRLGLLIRDLFSRWVPRAVAEKAVDDLQQAFTAFFKTPLGYVEGVWDGLMAVRIPWLSWPLFFGGSLVFLFLMECGAIYYDWPSPCWPTWYVGLIGSALWLVVELLVHTAKVLADFPRSLVEFVASLKDMVPEKVYRGLLDELARLALPYRAIREHQAFALWLCVLLAIPTLLVAMSARYTSGRAPDQPRRTRQQARQDDEH